MVKKALYLAISPEKIEIWQSIRVATDKVYAVML
jgi:hypothetical protein